MSETATRHLGYATRERFRADLRAIGAQSTPGLFASIRDAYTAPDRHYHDLTHIDECLGHLEAAHAEAPGCAEIAVALWYHDIVYDTRASDNEERSAQRAKEDLTRLGAPKAARENVADLILATKTHAPVSSDGALIVDVDLAILGAAPEDFERYDRAIRAEFSWVPEDVYVAARAAVLEGFLGRDRIFTTAHFRPLERRARRNLEEKLRELGASNGA